MMRKDLLRQTLLGRWILAVFRVFLPRSLLGRSLLIVVTPLIVLQVVSAFLFYEKHWDQVKKSLALGIAGEISLLVDSLKYLPDAEDRARLFDAAARHLEISAKLQEGAILASAHRGASDLEGELSRALRAHDMAKPFKIDSRSSPESVIINIQLAEGVLNLVTSRQRLFSSTTYFFVLWTLGTSLILLGAATLFMRNQVRPVLRLARAADAFGKGRDFPGFKAEGAREVRQAALAFIAMRSRINRQIAQRTSMLTGVSHDLRTPLTRMKLQLEMMDDCESVAALKEDVAEMEHMLEGYLAFARGEGREKPEPCDLDLLLNDAVRRARRKGGIVDLKTNGDMHLPLRRGAFLRCLNNLLDNALRYGSRVFVDARRRRETIEVMIDDDGPGIPEDQWDDVFKPFFRLEGSRNPVTGGIGLGLTIARDVVHSHGGEISLAHAPAGGLRVVIRLPV
jgi:two-component system osmolarity sensor histidine kinase EnvZ